ncbi:MAG: hypothetical protein ACREFX_13810 [Opitutaceae bacterium]
MSLPRLSRHLLWIFVALLMIALIGKFDITTGYEVSLFALYTVPVAMMGWRLGRSGGLVFAILAAVVMRWADYATHHPYAKSWIPWEIMANRVFLFAFIAISFDGFRRSQQRDRRRLRDFEAVVPMCSVCHRVRNEQGEWIDFEAQVQRRKAEPNQRLCSDCAKAKYVSELTL